MFCALLIALGLAGVCRIADNALTVSETFTDDEPVDIVCGTLFECCRSNKYAGGGGRFSTELFIIFC